MINDVQRPRVLLLTSKTGGGHVSLAEALRDRLEDRFDCTIVDPQPTIIHTHYRLVSRYALWLWQAEYRLGDHQRRAARAHRVLARVLARPMQTLLAQVQPQIMISTYALFTQTMAEAVRKSRRPIATAVLLADPQDVHAAWLAIKTCDSLLAPTRETATQSAAAGFTASQVHLSGWPVRRQFLHHDPTAGGDGDNAWQLRPPVPPVARAAALQALGLDATRFTVFLQGGGEGTARFAATVEAVLAATADPRHAVQIILATGTNERLRARFANTPRVHALPFTKEIAAYMALGDVIMGKAGPNMLFESVMLGKPFIATTYIPGQETPNLEFIRRHELGWVALQPHEQAALLREVVQQPAKLAVRAAAVDTYRRWNLERLATLAPHIARLIDRAATPS